MKQSMKVTHAWDRKYMPTGGIEKVYLLLEMKGEGEAAIKRAPVNVALVLDRSGSMHGSPLEYSKKACKFVTNQMTEEDTLSMVAFDDHVLTVFPPEQVTRKDVLNAKIEGIEAGGTTNLSGGLIQGAQYVTKSKKDGSVNRVILLSDGHANAGVTDPERLGKIAKEYQSLGASISTMGVGDGFDEELMEQIAEQGGGNFYYIEQPDDIPKIFSDELKGLLSVVAQNVSLTIQPSDFTVITGVYGYRAEQSHGEHIVHIGDVYDGELKTLLLEVAFHPRKVGKHPALLAEWHYVDVTEGANPCSVSYEIHAEFTNDINLLNEPLDEQVVKQVKLTEAAKVIEEAMEAFDNGDFEKGKMLISCQAVEMEAFASKFGDSDMLAESQILFDTIDNFDYSSAKRKELHQQKYRQMKRKKMNPS